MRHASCRVASWPLCRNYFERERGGGKTNSYAVLSLGALALGLGPLLAPLRASVLRSWLPCGCASCAVRGVERVSVSAPCELRGRGACGLRCPTRNCPCRATCDVACATWRPCNDTCHCHLIHLVRSWDLDSCIVCFMELCDMRVARAFINIIHSWPLAGGFF